MSHRVCSTCGRNERQAGRWSSVPTLCLGCVLRRRWVEKQGGPDPFAGVRHSPFFHQRNEAGLRERIAEVRAERLAKEALA